MRHGSFYRISISGSYSHSYNPGKPELPVFSRLISIPEGSEFKIKISDVRSSRINPSGKKIEGSFIRLRRVKQRKYSRIKPDLKLIKQFMLQEELIKADTVRIEPLGIVRNKKLANLIYFSGQI